MRITKTYFMLMVADMDRATRFWRDAFGLRVGYASPFWTELASGDAVVALHGGGTKEPRDTGLGFEVDDLQAACGKVTEGGGTIVKPPEKREGEGISLATAADTEGNRFSLTQPAR